MARRTQIEIQSGTNIDEVNRLIINLYTKHNYGTKRIARVLSDECNINVEKDAVDRYLTNNLGIETRPKTKGMTKDQVIKSQTDEIIRLKAEAQDRQEELDQLKNTRTLLRRKIEVQDSLIFKLEVRLQDAEIRLA